MATLYTSSLANVTAAARRAGPRDFPKTMRGNQPSPGHYKGNLKMLRFTNSVTAITTRYFACIISPTRDAGHARDRRRWVHRGIEIYRALAAIVMANHAPTGKDSEQSRMRAPELPHWPFRFDGEKALEALLYVIPRIKHPTFHSVSKILYHADREHMRQFARPITGDRYAAMKHGPVPSSTYNILKTVKGSERFRLMPPDALKSLRIKDEKEVVALREPNLDLLSESEQQCLEFSTREHGQKSFAQLSEESHDEAWNAVDDNDLYTLEQFLLTIDDSEKLREHFLQD